MTLHRIGTTALLKVLRRAERAPLLTRIMAALSERPGRILSHTELADAIWGDREDGGPDWTDSAMTVSVYRLRRRGARIKTHKWRGYSLRKDAA